MKAQRLKENLSILEAVDFLSSLSELDVTLPSLKDSSLVTDHLHPQRWLDQKLLGQNEDWIAAAFRSLHQYFQDIHDNHPEQLRDEHILKGLHSILTILDEAVEKLEKFTDLFKDTPGVESLLDLKEYKELQEYISASINPYFSDKEELWEEDLGIYEEELVGVRKKGMQDLQDIKDDRLYELFYLKKDDRKPFYDYDMVRRLKLLYDFDQLIEQNQEENSFIRIRQLQDKDFYQKAEGILKSSSHLIDTFYKEAMKMKSAPFVGALSKTLMALMLAANPRNWQSSAAGDEQLELKSSAEYFGDFHYYLREALFSPEYKKLLKSRSDSTNSVHQTCFHLIHKLCSAYFLTVSLQKETVSFIRRIIHTGSKLTHVKEPADAGVSPWKELLWEDDSIRQVLQKQPSGPVRRIIESFLQGEIGKGWDPLSTKNIPTHLFTLQGNRKEVAFLRMPAPLMQKSIQKAEVPSEFETFLRGCLVGDKHQKFLLVNLQDRTTWEEHSRSEALEDFSKKGDLVPVFSLIGLPKKTDFYYQRDVYKDVKSASEFMKLLLEQFEAREQCGFFWPETHSEESNDFAKKAIKMIHTIFFDKKKELTSSMRQNFIELFYFFLILKAVDLFHPDYMSLSCKDGVDTGAAATGCFFTCLRLLVSDQPWSEEEKDLLLWILYAPALFFRERAIHKDDLTRVIQAMHCFQTGLAKNKKELVKECTKLFEQEMWLSLEIRKAS